MEDYTYHLVPGEPKVLGAHMLEVCPSIAGAPPDAARSIRCRSAAARIRSGSCSRRRPGRPSSSASLDLGDRFRLVANEVELVEPDEELPRLPVARAVWRREPDFATAAEAWLIAGGPHHTALTARYGTEPSPTSPRSPGIELLVIDERHTVGGLRAASCAGTRPTTTSPAGCERWPPRATSASGRLEANREIVRAGLVALTFGNASGVDRAAGVIAIKPSGVPYDGPAARGHGRRRRSTMGEVVDGALRPSSDTPTHLALYRRYRGASAASSTPTRRPRRRGRRRAGAIPCFGTTHADHFRGPVPVTRDLTADEIDGEYEARDG